MPEVGPSRYLVTAGWDHVPHLDDKTKTELLAGCEPHLRDARSKGTPSLGAGAIYPVPESDIVCEPFAIPKHWRRAYGMDVGWKRTAVAWGALDPTEDVLYLHAEYYRGQAEPSIHAAAVRARGDWIPGAIDPAARGRAQTDGQKLMVLYQDLGLNVVKAENAVEAGIYAVLERMTTGRLKVFRTCQNWLAEWRLYRRDENGKIVKDFDHLMDATRYLVMTGVGLAIAEPPKRGATSAYTGPADALGGY